MRKPDFERNMLRVLRNEKPERATLFELFLNDSMYKHFSGMELAGQSWLSRHIIIAKAMAAAGYDYVPTHASAFHFPQNAKKHANTHSLNDNAIIYDWETFEKYKWPDPEDFDESMVEAIRPDLPEGMKLMVFGPCGMLENLIGLVGYDNLCFMLYDDPELLQTICDHIEERLVKYYAAAVESDTVGFLCANDDWGFNTQTFLSPADMRKYIFPCHKKIVELAHSHGKPCILHSCGEFRHVLDDIVDDIGFDARHSYEDNIISVEDSYELMHDRIAVLGGLDMNFLVKSTPEMVYARSIAMLDRAADRGGYALGSGNSIPEYVPFENFLAMRRAAQDWSGN